MKEIKDPVHKQILSSISRHTGDEIFQHLVVNLKSQLENMGDVQLTLARLKSIVSTVKKLNSGEKDYSSAPSVLKDYLGLMSIVDNMQQGQALSQAVIKRFGKDRNPSSDNYLVNTSFDPMPEKGYSTQDGYKNFRIHVMQGDIPVEIQIKTKNQYVAHQATHDPIYKAPELKTKTERRLVADKMYPYFDALAYYHLNKATMSPEEAQAVIADIDTIYARNVEVFEEYPEVFRNACTTFASYCFIYKHHKELFTDSTFRDSVLETKLIEGDVGRVFRYVYKGIYKNPQISKDEAFQQAIAEIVDMPYETFQQLNEQTAGEYRQGTVVLSGIMDVLREKDVKAVEHLLRNHKEVYIGVFSDNLASTVSDHEPIFSQQYRQQRAAQIKGVSGAFVIGTSGEIKIPTRKISPVLLRPITQQHKYDYAYVPGVYDMFHDGHKAYLESIDADYVFAGVKTDGYSIARKGKSPYSPTGDRIATVSAMKSVDEAFETADDITPPQEVLDIFAKAHAEGKSCAIYVGSDWINHPERKGEQSLSELSWIKENYPYIEFDMVPRSQESEDKISTTTYKQRAKDTDISTVINHSDITFMGEQNC